MLAFWRSATEDITYGAYFLNERAVEKAMDAFNQGIMDDLNYEVLDLHYTPLRCVEQVVSVDVLAEAPEGKRLPIKVAFEVKGVGRWDRELSIFMPSPAGERSESPVA